MDSQTKHKIENMFDRHMKWTKESIEDELDRLADLREETMDPEVRNEIGDRARELMAMFDDAPSRGEAGKNALDEMNQWLRDRRKNQPSLMKAMGDKFREQGIDSDLGLPNCACPNGHAYRHDGGSAGCPVCGAKSPVDDKS